MSNYAIHVPTWEDYLRLGIDEDSGISKNMWLVYEEECCVRQINQNHWVYSGIDYYKENKFDIITVDAYLKMQGRDTLKDNLSNALEAAEALEGAVDRGLSAAKENLDKKLSGGILVGEMAVLSAGNGESTNSIEDAKDVGDTNPKRQFGLASIPLHLWSSLASAYGSLGLYNGSLKYGRNNFKATPVEASIYIAAAKRHLSAWEEGEEFDPADGVPNLGGVLANIAILLEARAAGTLVDDRQMGTGYLKEREALKEIMKNVTEIHKDKNPRHYTIADNPKE